MEVDLRPDVRIVRFIRKHHVLTLATTVGDLPHCCHLFYAYVEEENYFVVSSAAATFHVQQLQENERIAASIVLESKVVGNLQGVQIRGTMRLPNQEQQGQVRKEYLKRFPFAVVMDLELWVIEPSFLKLTDNRLGFGKKLIWEKRGNL